jgi:hypothetical protein
VSLIRSTACAVSCSRCQAGCNRNAGFQPAVSRISNPQTPGAIGPVGRCDTLPTGSRRYGRLAVCATTFARAGLHAAADQGEFTPDRRKDNHDRLPFGLYPCHPCNPWFISSWFVDHGLHGLHGWAGDRVGRGEQVAAPSRLEVCATASACARAGLHGADDQSQSRPDRRKDNHHRLAFIRVIRVIRGSFLPGLSTTDYTDYTDGQETGSDGANKSLRPADWKSALRRRRAPEPAFTPPMTSASSHRTAGRTTTTGCRLAVIRVIRVIRGSFLPGFSTTDYTDGRETWSDGANKSLRPGNWKSALRRRRAPEPASTAPMTRASPDRTAGRTTTTGWPLSVSSVVCSCLVPQQA